MIRSGINEGSTKFSMYHTETLFSRRVEAHGAQLLEHFLQMRRRPVDLPALAAEGELLLRGKNVGRYVFFHFLLRDGFKKTVALHAAVKDIRKRIQRER